MTGVVACTVGIGDNVSQLQHSAPINRGNRGGPLFYSSGHVLGINVGMLDPGRTQNVNFSIKMGVTRNFLEGLKVDYVASDRNNDLPTEQIMASAIRYTVQIGCRL